ncbi:DUF5659 domain-containing protein [Metabacillus fastidiosus]|uniref:DUF5659 domain-containing protein n=1 Tax=Metabacillus fastidiosus TaxID=1458 RepID=UPI003D2BDCFD
MELKNYKKEDLFYCYSIHLFHFLKANNFYYLFKDKNPSSNKFYWVFERTPKFLEALTMYSNRK